MNLKNSILQPKSFNRTDQELEEYLLLAIFVAGKNSKTQSEKLRQFLQQLDNPDFPLSRLTQMTKEEIDSLLRQVKSGQYLRLCGCLYELSRANLNLRTCSCEDLENIHGIGFKTSRFFIVYSRENSNYAILDTHVLSWLRQFYPNAPKSTPGTKKQYKYWEKIFLNMCKDHDMMPSELDFEIWVNRQKSWN